MLNRLLMRLVCVLAAGFTGTALAAIPAGERQALLDLYTSTQGDAWTTRTGWNGVAGTECTWFGVTCTGGVNVIKVDLTGNNLVGTLPVLDGLTVLQDFRVTNNKLTGAIPPLAGLSSLRVVFLNNNMLSGSIPSLAGMTALEFFFAQGNKLTGSLPSLAGLTALKSFYASSNLLSGSLPSLSGLSALVDFRVGTNGLTGSIPALAGLTALDAIDLSSNDLSGTIPPLAGLTNLRVFFVNGNALTGSIPSLAGLTKLESFFAQNNLLTGSLPSLAGLIALKTFYAYDNDLTGTLPPLTGLVALIDFRVGANSLDGSIPSLAGPSALAVFDVSSNQLTGTIPALAGMAALRVFYVFNNALTGSIPSLAGLGALEFFYAHNNQLTGPIPSLAGLTALQQFYVFNNRLSGPIPPLTGLSALKYFKVFGNALNGPPPALPSPSQIVAGASPLCPNALEQVDNAAWNVVAGITPWWRGCVGFVAQPLPPPPPDLGQAGSAVGAARDVVAVGAPLTLVDGAESGRVLVYAGASQFANATAAGASGFSSKSLDDFSAATLQLPFPANGDRFGEGGVAVSPDGSVIAVGAPGTNGNTGSVAIFERPIGGWSGTIVAKVEDVLVPQDANPGDGVGSTVTITNAGTIIAGAPGTTVNGAAGAGVAFVIRKGDQTYTISLPITSVAPQPGAGFGSSVSGEGSELAVGAPGQDVSGRSNQGSVELFREAAGVYAPLANVTDATGAIGDRFGTAVGVSDGVLVVGAPGADQPGAIDAGVAVVFDQDENGGMAETANLLQAEPQAGAELGTSLAVSADTVIVGAPAADLNGNVDQGVVEVYIAQPLEVFVATPEPVGTLFDPEGEAGDGFGEALALSDFVAAVGAPYRTQELRAPPASKRAKAGAGVVAPGEVVIYTDSAVHRDGFDSARGGIGDCVSPNVPIPDNSAAGTNNDVSLPASGKVRNLDVGVRIAHAHVSDLRITLTHLGANRTVPLYIPTGNCPTNDLDVDFDDQALDGFADRQCSTVAPGVTGRLLPHDWLTIMQGVTRAGPWRLNVADVVSGDTGVLQSWCLDAR